MVLRLGVGLAAAAIALGGSACGTHTAPAQPQPAAASSHLPEGVASAPTEPMARAVPEVVTSRAPEPTPSVAPDAVPQSQAQAEAPGDVFVTLVRPVLSRHCAPCHEPGGKMYERLPFDRPAVVASHPEGVLKRLKGEDRATLAAWLETARGAASPGP